MPRLEFRLDHLAELVKRCSVELLLRDDGAAVIARTETEFCPLGDKRIAPADEFETPLHG